MAIINKTISQKLEDHRLAWCGFIIEALRQYNDNFRTEDEGKTLYATYLDMMIRWYPQIDQDGQDSYGKFASVRNSVEASTNKEMKLVLCENLKFSDEAFLQMLSGEGKVRRIHYEHNPPVKQIRDWLTIGFDQDQFLDAIQGLPNYFAPIEAMKLNEFCLRFREYTINENIFGELKEILYQFLCSEKYSVVILSKSQTNAIERRNWDGYKFKENGNFDIRLALEQENLNNSIKVSDLSRVYANLNRIFIPVESETHFEIINRFLNEIEDNKNNYHRSKGVIKKNYWYRKHLDFWINDEVGLDLEINRVLNNYPNDDLRISYRIAYRYINAVRSAVLGELPENHNDVFKRLLSSFYWLIISNEELIERFENAAN